MPDRMTIDEFEELLEDGGPDKFWNKSTDDWLLPHIDMDKSTLAAALVEDGIDGLKGVFRNAIKPIVRRAFLAGVADALKEQAVTAGTDGFVTSYWINGLSPSVHAKLTVAIRNGGEDAKMIYAEDQTNVAAVLLPVATDQ